MNSFLTLRETRTLYFLVQCSCQVFLAKNLLLISITAVRGGYEKNSLMRLPENSSYTRLTFFKFYAHNRYMLPHAYVEAALARHAAPCLAGIKPANLVSFPSADIQWCDTYNAILNEQGIYFTPLCVCENRTQILVYRKDLLACLCFHPQVVAALQYFGYRPESGLDAIIMRLKERMAVLTGVRNRHCRDSFPHEIGLFLGYPADDVMQYVKTGGRNCLFCGYWKVYSNPEQALQVFHQYTECKERFALQIKSGMTIFEIVCVA